MQIRAFLTTLILSSLLAGCLGSPRPRNPMNQRRDLVAEKIKKDEALIRQPPRPPLRPEAEFVLLNLPKNSWKKHDQDLHKNLGSAEANKYAKVYPWLKVQDGRKPKPKEEGDE